MIGGQLTALAVILLRGSKLGRDFNIVCDALDAASFDRLGKGQQLGRGNTSDGRQTILKE